jgi:probable F420-dependent oxidoreductase
VSVVATEEPLAADHVLRCGAAGLVLIREDNFVERVPPERPARPPTPVGVRRLGGALRHFCDTSRTPVRPEPATLTSMHPFRFGVVAAAARSGDEWLARAQRVEALGFDTLGVPDGLRFTLAPLPALAAAAAVTRTLRLTTYVLANDFRNPVLLAKEAASLDFLSGGRFELGIGAGRPNAAADNQALGIPFESGGVRVQRLAESLQALKAALTTETVSPRAVQQPHPPILVAGSGKQMLRLAAREADSIALGIDQKATEQDALDRVAIIREAAGQRFAHLELNLNLMAVGDQVPRYLSSQLGLTAQALADAGSASAITGTTQAMCDTLERRRERLGISYIMVADELMESLAPVVERLKGR